MLLGLGVAVHLSVLAVNAGASPGPNRLLETKPDKLSCHQSLTRFPAWVREAMHSIKNLPFPPCRDDRPWLTTSHRSGVLALSKATSSNPSPVTAVLKD